MAVSGKTAAAGANGDAGSGDAVHRIVDRRFSGTGQVRETAAEPSLPILSVVVPVFNESTTLTKAVERVLEEPTRKEVIIVDDGSDDGTAEILEEWGRNIFSLNDSTVRIVVLRHVENRGKGRAIRTALSVAEGQFVIVQDADLELSPSCYAALLAPLLSGTAQLVIGRRRRAGGAGSIHAIGIAALGLVVRALYGYNVQDPACCFKVLSLDNLRRMDLDGERFEFCPEVIAKGARLGLKLQQVDVAYVPRRADEGKKLRLVKDGIKAIQTLLRNRRWQPLCARDLHGGP